MARPLSSAPGENHGRMRRKHAANAERVPAGRAWSWQGLAPIRVRGSWLKAPGSVADTCGMGHPFPATPRKGDAQSAQTSTVRQEREGDRCDRTTASIVAAESGAIR